MKKKIFGLISLFLCFALLMSACMGKTGSSSDNDAPGNRPGRGDASGYEPDTRTRRTVKFSDMVYERPDVEALKTQVEELTRQAEAASDFKEIIKLDDAVSVIAEDFSTKSSLARLRSYQDITDEHYKAEYIYCDEAGVTLYTAINEFNRVLVEGPFSNEYKRHIGAFLFNYLENSLLLNSPTVEALKQQRNTLVQEYEDEISNLSVNYQGETYTAESMDEITSVDLYYQVANALYSDNADDMAALYGSMVAVDKEIAYILGFSSPADMYYLGYSRDYTPKDSLQLAENCKELFAPLVYSAYSQRHDVGTVTYEQIFEHMPTALEKVEPQLLEAWNSMIEYDLYDYEPRENKQQGGGTFNMSISSYDASFCFGSLGNSFSDVTTVMHEFGHYYDRWIHFDEETVFNLDVAEVYSQALELIMQKFYGDFTPNAEAAIAEYMQDFINPLTYQVMLHEFELRVYELESFDANVIASIYTELLAEYGFSWTSTPDENGLDHSWFRVTHIFQQPFYTISYCTSALVALQIWSVSQDDWDNGRDLYLDLIHADQNQPFTQLVTSVGLEKPMDRATLEKIAKDLEAVYTSKIK